ncbi:MAG: hypothetical protein N3E46_00680 [Gemmataceae bacterium]|nr:hypothetical protein [Gemmataceae bacterium]
MSRLLVQCPNCQARIKVSERLIGKTKPCPRCQTVLQFPADMAAVSRSELSEDAGTTPPVEAPPAGPSKAVGNYASPPVAPSYPSSSEPAFVEPEWIEEPLPVPQAEYSAKTMPSLPRLPTKRKYPVLVIMGYCFKVLACLILALFILVLLVSFVQYIIADNPFDKAMSWMEFRYLLLSTPLAVFVCMLIWTVGEFIFMLIHFEENVRAIGIGVIELCKKYHSN